MRGGIWVLTALVGGCGGGGLSSEFATSPDASVLTPAIKKVTLTSEGGGLGGGPCSASGVCLTGVWSYTLSLDTKRLAFTGSTLQGDPPMPVAGMADVSLTDPELQTLIAATRAVTVSARRECGADAPTRELRVESATNALTYGDDFYACLMDHDHFVTFEGLNSLQTAFAGISP